MLLHFNVIFDALEIDICDNPDANAEFYLIYSDTIDALF